MTDWGKTAAISRNSIQGDLPNEQEPRGVQMRKWAKYVIRHFTEQENHKAK